MKVWVLNWALPGGADFCGGWFDSRAQAETYAAGEIQAGRPAPGATPRFWERDRAELERKLSAWLAGK